MRAIAEELDSLLDHKTWKEVDEIPKGSKPIGCSWLFKMKTVQTEQIPEGCKRVLTPNSDGTSTRYKARLVIKGYRQKYGIDYKETFAPVMRTDILRLLMSLSITNKDLVAEQMDVVTAS